MSYYRSSTQRHVTIKLYYKHDNFTLTIPKNQVTTTKKKKKLIQILYLVITKYTR